jgi:hypothetical protein
MCDRSLAPLPLIHLFSYVMVKISDLSPLQVWVCRVHAKSAWGFSTEFAWLCDLLLKIRAWLVAGVRSASCSNRWLLYGAELNGRTAS